MNLKLDAIYLLVISAFLNGCSSYSEEDYGKPDNHILSEKKASLCINMEPAQEAKCKESEKSLIISLGADENCNHPYEYEKNRCKANKAKKKQLLDESLKKHKR